VALICVGLITWPLFNKMSRQKDIAEQTQMTQSIQMLDQDVYDVLNAPEDDMLAQTEALNTMVINADALIEKASETDNPNLAAMALIKGAQAIRTQMHLRKTLDAETLETQIEKARQAYQKAYETPATPTLKAMAQLGLGLCSEELGQTAQAAEIYQQIIENEDYQATVLPAQAQQRLDGLDENEEIFTFVEAPETPEVPAEGITQEIIAPTPDSGIESTPEEIPAVEEPTEPAVDTSEMINEIDSAAPAEEATEPVAETGESTDETTETAPVE
jgi:tetratricopeptide (TPR) repeat protein